MTCRDISAGDGLTLADDWKWVWRTEADVSNHADPVVTLLDNTGKIVATSAGDTPTIHLDGGLDGSIPATDFDAGVFAWWIPAEVTAGITASSLTLNVRVVIDGADTTVLNDRLVPSQGVPR